MVLRSLYFHASCIIGGTGLIWFVASMPSTFNVRGYVGQGVEKVRPRITDIVLAVGRGGAAGSTIIARRPQGGRCLPTPQLLTHTPQSTHLQHPAHGAHGPAAADEVVGEETRRGPQAALRM